METLLITAIEKAKTLESPKDKMSLIEKWVEDRRVKSLSTLDFLELARFIDHLLEDFSSWPALLEDGAHSCYVEKRTVLKILGIAKLNDNSANLAHFLGEELRLKHFLLLAFKWHSLAACLGNSLSKDTIAQLYYSSPRIVNFFSFRICRELVFILPPDLASEILESRIEELNQFLQDEELSKEKREQLCKQIDEITPYFILFQIKNGELKKDRIPQISDVNYADAYFGLKRDLSYRSRDDYVYRAMIGFLCLAFVFKGCTKETFDREQIFLFEIDKHNADAFSSCKAQIETTFGRKGIFNLQGIDKWLCGNLDERKAKGLAIYLLEHLYELTEENLRLSFEFCPESKEITVWDAFLEEYSEEKFPLYSGIVYDTKLLTYILNKANGGHFTDYFVYADGFNAESFDRLVEETYEDQGYPPQTVADLKKQVPDKFGIFSKNCVIYFSKNKKLREIIDFVSRFVRYFDFVLWLLSYTDFISIFRTRKERFNSEELSFIREIWNARAQELLEKVVAHLDSENTPVSRECLKQLERSGINVEFCRGDEYVF